MKLYHDDIIRQAKSTAGVGRLDGNNADITGNIHSAQKQNPLCGDDCTLHLQLDHDNSGIQILNAAHQTRGCILTLAAAETLVQLAREQPPITSLTTIARQLINAFENGNSNALPPPLQLFTPVIERKSRHNCVLLPFQALLEIAAQLDNRGEQ